MTLSFTVPGMPHGKERARTYYDARSRRYRSYTPKATEEYESAVARAFRMSGGKHMGDRAIFVDIKAYYPIPVRASQALRKQMLSGELVPYRTPDLDNVIKSILDGLNDVAYKDDSHAAAISAQKLFAPAEPYVAVTIWDDESLKGESACTPKTESLSATDQATLTAQ